MSMEAGKILRHYLVDTLNFRILELDRDLIVISSIFPPAPPREGLFLCPVDSAHFFLPYLILAGNICRLIILLRIYLSHNERGRRTQRGNGPLKAGTGRRKPQQVRARQAASPRERESTRRQEKG